MNSIDFEVFEKDIHVAYRYNFEIRVFSSELQKIE